MKAPHVPHRKRVDGNSSAQHYLVNNSNLWSTGSQGYIHFYQAGMQMVVAFTSLDSGEVTTNPSAGPPAAF